MHTSLPRDPVADVRQRLATALAGRYVLEAQTGWGGMALVFRARDLRHTRTVAIKVVRPELTTTHAAERFLDEVRIAARLQHPHIVPLYDSGEADGLVYFVMPYVEGETLRDRMDREERLPLATALAVVRDVADALGCAHEAGVVHRDIKPENILLAGGHALVADFGVALALNDRHPRGGQTDPGVAVGTYCYMSPEQASPRNGVDGRTDIYALACMLYEMLAGFTPWPDVQQRMYGGMAAAVVPPIPREDVPPAIQDAVAKALALRAEDRHATIGDFADALALSGVPRGVLRLGRPRIPTWLTAAAALTISTTGLLVGLLVGGGADQRRFVIAPCGGDTVGVGAEYCQWRLAEALEQWDVVRVVNPFDAVDAVRRAGLDRADSDAWFGVAEETRSGRLVRASLARVGDTTYLSGRLYDGTRRRALGDGYRVVYAVGDVTRPAAFASLVGGLLGLGDPEREPGVLGTRTHAAGQAYTEGRVALAAGDFVTARDRFSEAGREDPTFGDAMFWQAQVAAWLGDTALTFRLAAERAVASYDALRDPVAQRYARPLARLAAGATPEVCAEYRALARETGEDFAAWLGLADCLLRDRVVVEDGDSPTGFAFRASGHEAGTALRRALAIRPGAIAVLWPRLNRALPARNSLLRPGFREGELTVGFAAWPSLEGDTVAYFPHPFEDIPAGRVGFPDHGSAAIARHREYLAEVASTWVTNYPLEWPARLARAVTLEALGQVREDTELYAEALRIVRESPGRDTSVDARVAETRLLFRLGRYAEAAEVAVTLDPSVGDPAGVAGAFAYAGRPEAAAIAYARTPLTMSGLPPALHRLVTRLDVYGGLGVEPDSLRSMLVTADALAGRLLSTGEERVARIRWLDYLQMLAFPVTGRVARVPLSEGSTAQRWVLGASATDGEARLQHALDRRATARRFTRGGPAAPVFSVLDAWLALSGGDTALALGGLDFGLAVIAHTDVTNWNHPADAASLVRMMVMRSDLAFAIGDTVTARRWGGAALASWSRAAPEVRQTIHHLETRYGRDAPR